MLIIISGPSAVGKSRLCTSAAVQYRLITPLTTRAIRPDEAEGGEYHYVSREEFQRLILHDELNDWDYVFGEYYGAYKSDVELAVNSDDYFFLHALSKIAIRTSVRYPARVHTVMLLPSEDTSLMESRLRMRNANEREVQERLKHIKDEVAHVRLMGQVIPCAETMDSEEMLSQIIREAEARNER